MYVIMARLTFHFDCDNSPYNNNSASPIHPSSNEALEKKINIPIQYIKKF